MNRFHHTPPYRQCELAPSSMLVGSYDRDISTVSDKSERSAKQLNGLICSKHPGNVYLFHCIRSSKLCFYALAWICYYDILKKTRVKPFASNLFKGAGMILRSPTWESWGYYFYERWRPIQKTIVCPYGVTVEQLSLLQSITIDHLFHICTI